MNSGRPTHNETKPTASTLIRSSGLAAVAAGVIFAGIQPIHPPDVLASVTTGTWAVINALKLAMCLFFLIGFAGLYVGQLGRIGWLGFAGFLMLTGSWFLQTGFVFAEVLILPPLATVAPQFIDSYLGIVNGSPGSMYIGALVPVYAVVGALYVLGGIAFGIATFRAGVLPRWAAGLLAVTALVTPAAALVPHAIQRLVAIPMGIALIGLGLPLWLGRSADVAKGSLHSALHQPQHLVS